MGGLGSNCILTPYVSPDSSTQPSSLPALKAPPAFLSSSVCLPYQWNGGEGEDHSLKGASPSAEVQGAFPMLVRDVGVSSCRQQHVDTGSVAGSAGLVQGGAALGGPVWPGPPPQQQPQNFCVAPAGCHVQGGGQLLFV